LVHSLSTPQEVPPVAKAKNKISQQKSGTSPRKSSKPHKTLSAQHELQGQLPTICSPKGHTIGDDLKGQQIWQVEERLASSRNRLNIDI
jgi:hypothetical protein